MFNDSLSNMFVSINRGIVKKQFKVTCKKSKKMFPVLMTFFKEGIIDGFRINPYNKNELEIILKYYNGKSIINKIIQISTSGRKVYMKKHELINKFLFENHLMDGILILSTSKGLMTHNEAFLKKLGGKIICKII